MRRLRLPTRLLPVVAALATAACGGSTPASAPTTVAPTSSSTTAPATTAAPTTTTTTAPACSNASVVASWPVARKAALLLVPSVTDFDPQAEAAAANAGAGGIFFVGNSTAPSDLGAQLAAAFRGRSTPVPPLVMADEEGGGIQRLVGPVTSMPWPRQMAQTMTTSQVQQLTAQVGRQMRSLGVGVDLAPVLDVDGGVGPNAQNPDGSRSFSPDPTVATRYGLAFSAGLASAGVLPVVKHFPGLGGSSGDTDYVAAHTLPISQLDNGGLIPFRAAIANGARAVMVANAWVPGLTSKPASLSPQVITGLLRDQLGFRGLVMTDSLSAGAISQSGYSVPAAAVAAVEAGADMVLFGSASTSAAGETTEIDQTVAALSSAVSAGALPLSTLNAAAGQVVAAGHVNLCSS